MRGKNCSSTTLYPFLEAVLPENVLPLRQAIPSLGFNMTNQNCSMLGKAGHSLQSPSEKKGERVAWPKFPNRSPLAPTS